MKETKKPKKTKETRISQHPCTFGFGYLIKSGSIFNVFREVLCRMDSSEAGPDKRAAIQIGILTGKIPV